MSNKVLFLTLRTFSFTGGIEKVCRTLARVLFDLNIEAKVYSLYDSNSDRNSKYSPKHQFTGYAGNRVIFVIKSVFQGVRSEIVILSHINLLLVALIIKTISPKTRIILYAHGIEVWRSISSWKRNFLTKKCELWAVSNFTSNKLQKIHNIDLNKITVIPNCLDPFLEIPNHFEKPVELLTRYNLTINQPLIFTLTRLSSNELYKGYERIIEALPELIKIYPTLHYLLSGKADSKERVRLQDLITKLNLQQHITLTGFLDEDELSAHFLLSDIFILPSHKEGFGIVFIEAAACGCKVIGGNQDGSMDALLNGKLGTLVQPEEKESILIAICKNLEMPRSEKASKAVQNLCLEYFNYEQYFQKVQGMLLYPDLQGMKVRAAAVSDQCDKTQPAHIPSLRGRDCASRGNL